MKTSKVVYQGRTYQVLADSYIGNQDLYRLASRFSLGAAFGALKSKCRPV